VALGAGSSTVAESVPRRLYEVLSLEIVGFFLAARVEVLAALISLVLVVALAGALWRGNDVARFPTFVIIGMVAATVALGVVYRGPIFPHYFLALTPAVFLLLGAAVYLADRYSSRLARAAASGTVLALLGLNLLLLPIWPPPERQLEQTRQVADAIGERSNGAPFALLLIAVGDSDGAYRFWLERSGFPPAPADAPPPPQLFVICRQPVCARPSEWSDAQQVWQTDIANERIEHLVREQTALRDQ
jgi:hypothetical protein